MTEPELPSSADDPAGGEGGGTAPAGSKKVYLTVGSLAMINVAAVMSLRNFPAMALYGWASVTWYVIGAVVFLVPVALIGAELATGPWRQEGGMYSWVRAGLGERSGLLAVWQEWTENIVWFPTILSFIAATLAYALNPDLANNGFYMLTVMLTVFWVVTAVCFFGSNALSKLTNIGTIIGTLVPGGLLIVLMVVYLVQGNSSQVPLSASAFSIDVTSITALAFASSVVLIFAGVEVAGFSATDTKDPQRDFPKAMFLSAGIIFGVTVLGTLAIVVVVDASDINLTAGLMQAFEGFFSALNIEWMTPVVAVLIVAGSVAGVGAWALGPARGLGVARGGDLPPLFRRHNRHGSPVGVLLLQAVLSSVLALLFVVLPSVSAAYWVLSALTTGLTCIMYTLMFGSALRMRKLKPLDKYPRGYTVSTPWLYYTLCIAGLGAVLFCLVFTLLPTDQTDMSTGAYILTMFIGTFVLAFFPFVFVPFRKASWKSDTPAPGVEPGMSGDQGVST